MAAGKDGVTPKKVKLTLTVCMAISKQNKGPEQRAGLDEDTTSGVLNSSGEVRHALPGTVAFSSTFLKAFY